MYYSAIGILALLVLLIVNQDVIFKAKDNEEIPALKYYRLFLFGVLVFYVCDFMWGIFDLFDLMKLLYVDTILYFFVMALVVVFWAKYAITYLAKNSLIGKILVIGGNVFLLVSLIFLIINFFSPIVFEFNESGEYNTYFARYIIFGLQIIMFSLTAIYTLAMSIYNKVDNKTRYRAIGLFSLAMVILISIQIYFPLLPVYSAGYMIGTCVLHSFIIEDEKEEYKERLENSLNREIKQKKELGSAMKLAYTDSLTGLNNKLAYLELEEKIENNISSKDSVELSVVVLDLNDLKLTNDTLGHEKGDEYLVKAGSLICEYFPNSKVFRIGGDEFAIILDGQDYLDRYKIVEKFNAQMEKNIKDSVNVLIAIGIADYDEKIDTSYQSVFERADKAMYQRQDELKKIKKSTII